MGEEKEVFLVVEEHVSHCTPARTWFRVQGPHRYICSLGFSAGKTHVKHVYLVERGSISNRGNVRRREFTVEGHTSIDFLLNPRPLSEEEVEALEALRDLSEQG